MAYRDKSQGFGFVYVDVAKVLRESKLQPKENTETPPPKAVTFNNLEKFLDGMDQTLKKRSK